MLACARLGAPHTVVFGGFSADSLADRLNDMGCEVLITQDEGLRNGGDGAAQAQRRRSARTTRRASSTSVVLRRTGGEVGWNDERDRWWHELVADEPDDPASCPCEPMDAEDLLYLLYTSGTTAKPKGIAHTTAGYLVGTATTHYYIFDVKPDSGLLVRGRHRLGHRAQLHRLRAALQRHHERALRGRARLPGQGPLVGDRRALQGGHPLHGADGDPHAHEVGARVRRAARPLVAAAARLGRRADQPGGVGLVPRAHRRRPHADRRHVVADRDRDDLDHAAPGSDDAQARLGDEAVPRRRTPRSSTSRATRSARAAAATSSCGARGRRCCAGSTRTTSATGRRTGRGTRTSTSPATAPGSTRTATSGCSAASTT